MGKCWTIYCHTHIESGRRYVGLTSQTWRKRWKNHMSAAKSSKGGRWHFPNAIRKYGKDAFSHEVLEISGTLEEANSAEEKWIAHFDSRNPKKGFNLEKGGGHTPHPTKNPWDRPEYRAKCLPISRENQKKAAAAASAQKTQSRPEVRAKLSTVMKELANTPEGRAQRVAAANPGKTLGPEHRAKISASSRSKDSDVRARISAGVRKAFTDPEVKVRVMAASKKGMAHPEVREAISRRNRERPRRTHCKNGHPMDDVYIYKNGVRKCRACGRDRDAIRRARRREREAENL